MIWSEHTEFLLEELHYRGIFNKQRPNRNIIDSDLKQLHQTPCLHVKRLENPI